MNKGKKKNNKYSHSNQFIMIKAYDIEGNTCYGEIGNMESVKHKLEEFRQENKLDAQEQPVLVFEHDEDMLSRPLFQKIHIAHYNKEWIL